MQAVNACSRHTSGFAVQQSASGPSFPLLYTPVLNYILFSAYTKEEEEEEEEEEVYE